jgi:hypothetical protein
VTANARGNADFILTEDPEVGIRNYQYPKVERCGTIEGGNLQSNITKVKKIVFPARGDEGNECGKSKS